MANPNPSPATRFRPGLSGNPNGKRSLAWLHARLDRPGPDGKNERERILEHLIEVATKWTIIHRGEEIPVASGRDAVEAAKIIYAYAEGKAPESQDVRSLALAEHMRKVAHDAAELALKILGSRVYSMSPTELAAFFRECSGDTQGFIKAANAEAEATRAAGAIEASAIEPAQDAPPPEAAPSPELDEGWPGP